MRTCISASEPWIDRLARAGPEGSRYLGLSLLHGGNVGGILKNAIDGDEARLLSSRRYRSSFPRILDLFDFDVSQDEYNEVSIGSHQYGGTSFGCGALRGHRF